MRQHLILLPTAEDAEEVDEEIDEVEIERESSEESKLLSALAGIRSLEEHLLDFLGIISGKSYENEHTNVTKDIGKAFTLDEHVNKCGNNQAYQSHE